MDTMIDTNLTNEHAASDAAVDRTIYRPPTDHYPLESVYFYYIRLRPQEEIRGYYFDNGGPINNIDAVIKFLANNARADRDFPPKIAAGTKWRRKSYLVHFLDDALSEFIPNRALEFYPASGNYKDNYAFFGGEDRQIDMSDTVGVQEIRTAVLCLNQMDRDDNGTDLGDGERHEYRFRLNYTNAPLTLALPDSGGTNMGPPVPPPAIF